MDLGQGRAADGFEPPEQEARPPPTAPDVRGAQIPRRALPTPQRRVRSPDHRAGPGLLPPRSSGGRRGRGAAPQPARALPRSLQTACQLLSRRQSSVSRGQALLGFWNNFQTLNSTAYIKKKDPSSESHCASTKTGRPRHSPTSPASGLSALQPRGVAPGSPNPPPTAAHHRALGMPRTPTAPNPGHRDPLAPSATCLSGKRLPKPGSRERSLTGPQSAEPAVGPPRWPHEEPPRSRAATTLHTRPQGGWQSLFARGRERLRPPREGLTGNSGRGLSTRPPRSTRVQANDVARTARSATATPAERGTRSRTEAARVGQPRPGCMPPHPSGRPSSAAGTPGPPLRQAPREPATVRGRGAGSLPVQRPGGAVAPRTQRPCLHACVRSRACFPQRTRIHTRVCTPGTAPAAHARLLSLRSRPRWRPPGPALGLSTCPERAPVSQGGSKHLPSPFSGVVCGPSRARATPWGAGATPTGQSAPSAVRPSLCRRDGLACACRRGASECTQRRTAGLREDVRPRLSLSGAEAGLSVALAILGSRALHADLPRGESWFCTEV